MKNSNSFINDLILRLELIISKSRDLSAEDIETLKEVIVVLKGYQGTDDNSYRWISKVIFEVLPEILEFLEVFVNADL